MEQVVIDKTESINVLFFESGNNKWPVTIYITSIGVYLSGVDIMRAFGRIGPSQTLVARINALGPTDPNSTIKCRVAHINKNYRLVSPSFAVALARYERRDDFVRFIENKFPEVRDNPAPVMSPASITEPKVIDCAVDNSTVNETGFVVPTGHVRLNLNIVVPLDKAQRILAAAQ